MLPSCETRAGCENQDVLADFELNEFVETFMKAKRLSHAGHKRAEELMMDQLGLFDDTETLLQLENVWCDYIEAAKRKARMQADLKSKANKKGYRKR